MVHTPRMHFKMYENSRMRICERNVWVYLDTHRECFCRSFVSASMACWKDYNRYLCYDTYLHVYHYMKEVVDIASISGLS